MIKMYDAPYEYHPPKSQCCGAELIAKITDEGTGHFDCEKCLQPSNPDYGNTTKTGNSENKGGISEAMNKEMHDDECDLSDKKRGTVSFPLKCTCEPKQGWKEEFNNKFRTHTGHRITPHENQ